MISIIAIILAITLFSQANGEMKDPVAFTAIKGTVNGPYIAFQTLLVNNNVRLIYKTAKF